MTKAKQFYPLTTLAPALCASLLAFLLATGCEYGPAQGFSWDEAAGEYRVAGTNDGTTDPADPGFGDPGDAVAYSALNWTYGGDPKATGATSTGVRISNMSVTAGMLTFKYDSDLSAWGFHNKNHMEVACVFVKNNGGKWVGGKIDWISSNHTSRPFNHMHEGYGGWSLADVPNPCEIAFVIVTGDGKRRSNVLAGTWRR